MKACIWKFVAGIGGTETSLLELARFLIDSLGFSVDVYGDPVWEPFVKRFGVALNPKEVATFDEYDLLLLNDKDVTDTPLLVEQLKKIPVRIAVYGGYIKRSEAMAEVCPLALVKDRRIKGWLSTRAHFKGVKVSQFPIDLDHWKSRQISTPGKPVTIGYVGRTEGSKNIYDFWRMTRPFESSCKVKMIITGINQDEEQLAQFVKDGIEIKRNVVDVRTELDSFDIFQSGSLIEGVPRSVMEAMALSKPVVVYTVGGVHDLNPKFMTAPGADETTLYTLKALVGNAHLRRVAGEENRKKIELYNQYVCEDLFRYFKSI